MGYAMSMTINGFLFAPKLREKGYITLIDVLQGKTTGQVSAWQSAILLYLLAVSSEPVSHVRQSYSGGATKKIHPFLTWLTSFQGKVGCQNLRAYSAAGGDNDQQQGNTSQHRCGCCISEIFCFVEAYGKSMGAIVYLPSCIGDICWTGAVLSALGSTLAIILDMNQVLTVILSATVAVTYTLIGGMYSVAFTDVIQLVSKLQVRSVHGSRPHCYQ